MKITFSKHEICSWLGAFNYYFCEAPKKGKTPNHMTSESYFIILVFLLLSLKLAFSANRKTRLQETGVKLLSASNIPSLILFIGATLVTVLIANQSIGIALIFGGTWLVFLNLFKKLGYSFITGWSFLVYASYLSATYLGTENIPNYTPWFLLVFALGYTFILVLILDLTNRISSILSILIGIGFSLAILILPLNFISYFVTFGNPIAEGQINAILQTTISESVEFFGSHSSWLNLLIVLGIPFSAIYFMVKQSRFSTQPFTTTRFVQITVVIVVLAHLQVLSHNRIIDLVFSSAKKYQSELTEFRKELEKRKAGEINFEANTDAKNELIIVIIGESLNKNHMGIYGYHRNTTPHLSKLYKEGKLVKFDQAFSNHVHTVETLTHSLTEANQINNFGYNSSLSILDIQDQAGFETYWISNQVAFGGWDNPVSVLAERADYRYNLNTNIGLNTNTSVYDIQLVEKLQSILEQPITKNTVIYLHLMGNHGGYKNRYPKEFQFYREPFQTKNYGSKDYWYQHINEYDNSVLYNDFIVSEIIKLADNTNTSATCVYFSDHSEDVLENNGHDRGNFTFPMTQVPMLVWYSDLYQDTYPDKIINLEKNQDSLFSNGFVYDVLIGLGNIKTNHYSPAHDLSDSTYTLSIDQSFTMHGEHAINEDQNYFYHEKNNLKIIQERGELSRVFPHRTNTIGALSTILYDGCNSFELDVEFSGIGDTSHFEVGHGQGEMAGMTFEDVLEFSKDYNVQKIWMDIKNINDENLSSVINRLQYLDKIYAIKSKVIVETSMVKGSFARFSELGYHTSYYIPTHYNDYNEVSKANVAREISQQIARQKTSAISFDFALYPFVKQYIEPLIDSSVVYHTWNVSYGFQQPDLIEKLDHSDYYKDPRVKTILVKYQNNFEL